jgi:hypothetical protein
MTGRSRFGRDLRTAPILRPPPKSLTGGSCVARRQTRGGLVRVAGNVSSRHLRRWLVAIVMIAGVAMAGAGRSGPSAPGPAGDPLSPAMAASVSGPVTQGIMPVQPQIEAASGYQRGVRVKLPVLLGAVAATSLAGVVASRSRFRRRPSARQPLALRGRSFPRRAPPLLPLG